MCAPGTLGARGVDGGDRDRAVGATAGAPIDVGVRPLVAGRGDDVTPGRGQRVDTPATRGSSREPNGEPSDMLTTSTPSLSRPVHGGDDRRPRSPSPRSRTRGRHRSSAFGATPGPTFQVLPCTRGRVVRAGVGRAVGEHAEAGRVPATWEPWPLQSSGSGSGFGIEAGVGRRRRRRRRSRSRRRPWRSGTLPGSIDGRRRWREVGRVARAAEVGVGVVDTGVDDRDLDAGAGEAVVAPGGGRADERHAAIVVEACTSAQAGCS